MWAIMEMLQNISLIFETSLGGGLDNNFASLSTSSVRYTLDLGRLSTPFVNSRGRPDIFSDLR